MRTRLTRTTVAVPERLLREADKAVDEGWAASRNQFFSNALRRELAARERARIDADLAEMANDPEYLAEAQQISKEFEQADWEAFKHAEDELDS